ncbi:hypothetical protein BCR44DRAFT_1033226 [Catenaria anguillulae PL171]|uniref:Uncharacterized protein n=1 Tax=Catenaria anguillulae PL171 TaxID=765915 RepID=A0A1Y2HSC1_9FUNG|nr:hypothetical protein BCR44DRAFT_1033226 [Catenaria anguillulae PL171]
MKFSQSITTPSSPSHGRPAIPALFAAQVQLGGRRRQHFGSRRLPLVGRSPCSPAARQCYSQFAGHPVPLGALLSHAAYRPPPAAASSTATEVDLTAPHQNPTDAGANNTSGYQEPVMSNRFRLLVKSLDQFLDLIVAPVTVENLKTELTNMSRDDPQQAQAYVDGVRHYVIERSKRHLVWFLHTEKLKEKLDRLDRDIYEARLQVAIRRKGQQQRAPCLSP